MTADEIRSAIEAQLRERLDSVPPSNRDWNELGMDSLEMIDIFLKLEEELGRSIPVENFSTELTTDTLVEFLLLPTD